MTHEPHPEARAAHADWRTRLDRHAAERRIAFDRVDTAVVRGREIETHDIGVDGIADGWVLRGGLLDQLADDAYGWLLDTDIAVAQERFIHHVETRRGEQLALPERVRGWEGEAIWASGRFKSSDGAGLRLLLPTRWNHRLAVLCSGTGIYRDLAAAYMDESARRPGALLELGEDTGFALGLGANLYAELLLDRGYAVAWLRKDEVRAPNGRNRVRAEDGSELRVSHHSNLAYTLGLIELAQERVATWAGERPQQTYLYGHSSGATTARLANLRPEANYAVGGDRIVDGIIGDDAGAAMYLPLLDDADGNETVWADPASRAAFVPQLDVSRALFQPAVYLPLKRLYGDLARQRGVSYRYRHYEVADVSHFDGGMAGRPDIPDLGGLFLALWDALDAWCSEGLEPPRSRERGDAVHVPEVAVPLGTFAADGGGPMSSFAPYDARDGRPSLTEAWRELGLLNGIERFTADCHRRELAAAAEALLAERLFAPEAAAWYVARADELRERSGARP